jgi:hypothetical protein
MPRSLQQTTSPSISQDLTLRWFTASTTKGVAGSSRRSHQPVAVVLDLVNPVGAGRGLVGGGRKAGLDEFGVGGEAPTHTLDQHAPNLGGRGAESNRNEITARRIGRVARCGQHPNAHNPLCMSGLNTWNEACALCSSASEPTHTAKSGVHSFAETKRAHDVASGDTLPRRPACNKVLTR